GDSENKSSLPVADYLVVRPHLFISKNTFSIRPQNHQFNLSYLILPWLWKMSRQFWQHVSFFCQAKKLKNKTNCPIRQVPQPLLQHMFQQHCQEYPSTNQRGQGLVERLKQRLVPNSTHLYFLANQPLQKRAERVIDERR